MAARQGPGQGRRARRDARVAARGHPPLSVLLHPYMPASVERLLAALGATERSYDAATFAPVAAAATVETLPPLFPKR